MEKLVHRGNNFPANSAAAPSRSSADLDFDDVFGGPPRRFSMQEVKVRYSFGESEEEGAAASTSSPFNSLKEKPVFGEESAIQKKRHQGDDFFDDIFRGGDSYSSPRRTDRGSPFESNPGSRVMSPARPLPPKSDPFGTSMPALFSLPAKLTKGVELPTFSSRNYGSTNGLNSPHSSSSLSRFSNQAIRGQDEVMRNEAHIVSRVRTLSRDASFSSEEDSPPSTVKSDPKDNFDNSKKETKIGDKDGNQFHFSIYKWAGRGVPMLATLVGNGNNLKNNSKSNLKNNDNVKYDRSASSNGSIMDSEFLKMENEEILKKDSIKEAFYEIPESEYKRDFEQPGNVTKTEGTKSKNVTKNEGTKTGSRNDTVEKSRLRSAAINSGVMPRKTAVKGKVRDFVQILNQEADSTPKASGVQTKSQSSRWKNNLGVDSKESEVVSDEAKAKTEDNLHTVVDNKKGVSDKVDEKPSKNETEQYAPMKTPRHNKPESSSINPEKTFSSDTLRADPKISVENSDDTFEVNFMVQELSDDHDKVAQSESSEDTKAIDAKIRQWSSGKKGNIRSLLSTLQYVLWLESGWKPVPLVDLIEANSVKRAYQKALLRLHPDKLQQKGAAFLQKYTAEKVFDILQEAWDHFNNSSSLNL